MDINHSKHLLIGEPCSECSKKLVSEDNTGVWNLSKFNDVMYSIPDSMVKGKSHIRVKFQALPGNTAGPVYMIRLLKDGNGK